MKFQIDDFAICPYEISLKILCSKLQKSISRWHLNGDDNESNFVESYEIMNE